MARNPAQHARPALLLILTAGVGVLAASFSATLDHSSDERPMCESGADVRVTGGRLPPQRISRTGPAVVDDIEEVEVVVPMLQEEGWTAPNGAGLRVDVLAVRPDEFLEAIWMRPSLATSGEEVRAVPPTVTEVDWTTFRLVAAVFALIAPVILIYEYRLPIHHVMRLGVR